MRQITAAFYLSLFTAANAAFADPAAIADLRAGGMEKLTISEAPIPAPDVAFQAADGSELHLGDFEGKVLVVNFWATWCAPCREEMPTLAALQEEFGGEDFEVLTIATGRNDAEAMDRFLTEVGAEILPQHRDARSALARSMGVLGLPVTVVLDREGREVARLVGDADWHSDPARAIIATLIEG